MRTASRQLLNIFINANVPVIMWGPPGVAKTSYLKGMCTKAGYHIETIIASGKDPTDFGGLPCVVEGQVQFQPMPWLMRADRIARQFLADAKANNTEPKKVILFFDELSSAPQSVQAPLLTGIQERLFGDLMLPENVVCVAAANPPEIAANGQEMAPPMANRFGHIQWDMDGDASQYWVDAFISDFGQDIPFTTVSKEQLAQYSGQAKGLIITAIKRGVLSLFDFKPERLQNSTPRSIHNLSLLLAWSLAMNMQDSLDALTEAVLGEGPAVQFANFVRNMDVPSPQQMLKEGKDWDVKSLREDVTFVALESMMSYVRRNVQESHVRGSVKGMDVEEWRSAWDVMYSLAVGGRHDLAVSFIPRLVTAIPEGLNVMKEASVRQLFMKFRPIMQAAGVLS